MEDEMVALKCNYCGGKNGFNKLAFDENGLLLRDWTCGHCGIGILGAGTRPENFRDGVWVNDGKWFEKDYAA
jgi:hypothetical protein